MNLITTIIGCLVGILGIIIGISIRKYKITNWIAGFNPNKYDLDKSCKIFGDNIIFLGILLCFYAVIFYIANNFFVNSNLYTILYSTTIILVWIKIKYSLEKYAKK